MRALGQLGRILGRAARCWIEDDAPQLGAGLAYYSLFAAAPLLIIAAAIAGAVFGEEAVRRGLESQLAHQFGAEPAKALIGIVEIASKPRHGLWAGLAGAGALVIGAVSFFASLRSALSRIWKGEAKARPSGLAGIVGTYTIATVLVVCAGLLLLAALLIAAALAALEGLGRDLSGSAPLWRMVELAVSFVVTTLVFAGLFVSPRISAGVTSGSARSRPRSSTRSARRRSASMWNGAACNPVTARRARSSCSCCGYTTRRRSSCSAPRWWRPARPSRRARLSSPCAGAACSGRS